MKAYTHGTKSISEIWLNAQHNQQMTAHAEHYDMHCSPFRLRLYWRIKDPSTDHPTKHWPQKHIVH